ncbi:MAG: SH3 domain-containing protein, partial [Anaerolineae bacterium]|nr:SH3 domain-containing protein [Anaerolineae bacterium]
AQGQLSAAQTQVAAVQPTVQAAQAQIDAIVPTLAFAETRVAGVEPTLAAANTQVAGVEPTLAQAETQIAGVQPTLSFIQDQVIEQRQIVDALRLVRAAQQLLETSNPDLAIALVLEAYRLNPTLGETQRILNNALPLTVRLSLESVAPDIVGTRQEFVSILRDREKALLDPDRFIFTESNALQRFSPDERFLALARRDGVEIWSPTTRTRLHNLRTEAPVSALVFSSNGQILLGGLSNGQIVVWDAGTGQELRRLVSHTGAVLSLAYHPDLPRVISSADDRLAILWDVDEGRVLGTTPKFNSAPLLTAFNANGSEAYAFDFDTDSPQVGVFRLGVAPFLRGVRPYRAISPNGANAVVGSDGRTFLELWDADSGVKQREFRLGNFNDDFIRQIAFSNDNRSILVAAEKRVYAPDRTYTINGRYIAHWDIVTGGEIRRFEVPFTEAENWEAYSLAFSPDDRLALVGTRTSRTYSVLLYDVATGREVRRWKGHQSPIVRVAFSPLGTYAISTSDDGNVRVWDARSVDLNLLKQVRIPAESLGDFGLSADGSRAYVSFNGRSMVAWDLRTGQEVGGTRFTSGVQKQVVYNPALPQALILTLEQLTLYDLNTTRIVHRFDNVRASELTALAFSTDGQSIWYAERGQLFVWDSAAPRQRRLILPDQPADPTRYDIRFIAPAPNGEYVAVILSHNQLAVYDLIEKRFIWSDLDEDRVFNSLSYSSDSGRLLTALGEPDNTLVLWDALSGRRIYNLVGHSADVLSAAFGPDGTIALSGGLDTRLILWDLLSGQIIREYSGHTAPVRQVVFVPTGGAAYSRSDSLADGLLAWSVQSARETVNFVYNNRYIPLIDCQQRQQYGVQPPCGPDGIIPPPLPTPTSQATATPTPTATPRPTLTPTPTPAPRGVLQGEGGSNINVRSGAGPGFSLVTQAPSGTPVEILEILADIGWARIQLPDGQVGWVRSSLIRRTN